MKRCKVEMEHGEIWTGRLGEEGDKLDEFYLAITFTRSISQMSKTRRAMSNICKRHEELPHAEQLVMRPSYPPKKFPSRVKLAYASECML